MPTPEKPKPTPNVPSPPPDEESTGQHVRVKLEELDKKLDEAIKVDKDDHKRMTDTMQGITRIQNQHYGEIQSLRQTVSGMDARLAGVDGKVDGMTRTADAIMIAVDAQSKHNAQQGELKVAEKKKEIEVQGAKEKAATDDEADKKKVRRGLSYRVIYTLIGLAGLAIGHLAHVVHC